MIVVNYWIDKDYNPITDGYVLELAGIINDSLDLNGDVCLIKEAIDNDDDFNPKLETFYEIYLTRATIDSDPIPEPAFVIKEVVEKKRNPFTDQWQTPLVRM